MLPSTTDLCRIDANSCVQGALSGQCSAMQGQLHPEHFELSLAPRLCLSREVVGKPPPWPALGHSIAFS
eukprot:900849-Amphidinium_carterae.1